jgi:hypothetical protein
VTQVNDVSRRNGKEFALAIGLNQDSTGVIDANPDSGELLIAGHKCAHASAYRATALNHLIANAAGYGISPGSYEAGIQRAKFA